MKVLHLEDCDLDAEITAAGLFQTWPDCRIERASTRVEFETALGVGEFDLILSDYTMTGFDGLTALALAHTYCPEKPFIFLSGTIGEERAIEALRGGATNYVLKDRPARLVPAMKEALARAEDTRHHRETEEALRQTQDNFRHIAENVTDLIIMSDLTGHCLYCNPAYSASVGRTADAHSRPDIFADVYPEDYNLVHRMFCETVISGTSRRIEYRLVGMDRKLRCIEAQNTAVRNDTGEIVKVLILARDMTERNDTERRLRQQAALLDHAQDAILVRDLNDHISYWNLSAARIYGWSAEEARDRAVAELWDEDIEQAKIACRQTMLTGKWMGELRQQTKAGETLVMQSRWTRVSGGNGDITAFFVINTDISEKKRLEAHLLSIQRTESIGLLAGGVAHDINNLLTPVLCSAEMLETMVTSEEAKRYVAMIHSSAQFGAALVQQLLAFARGVPSQKSEVALIPLLRSLSDFVAQSFGRAVPLSLSLPDEACSVWGDATQLKQVFMNLCINARDAMPNGGRISITLRNTELSETVAASLPGIQPGFFVKINVSDTGTGIPATNLKRIFDPFFTTKKVGKGIGLGLAAVQGLVRGHNGTITVESELGRGSSFCVYLPAFSRAALSAKAGTVAPFSPQGRGQAILVVDDEASLREVISSLLNSNGYQVYKAGSGDEALRFFKKNNAEIELVLTDINMPGMEGFELIGNLRRLKADIPIVAFSGMTGSIYLEERASEFHVPILAKPVSRETLLAAVAAALALRGLATPAAL